MLMDITWNSAHMAARGVHWLGSLGYLELPVVGFLLGAALCVVRSGARRAIAWGLASSVFVLSLKLLNDPALPLP
jgi:hypothetical protein